MKTFSVILLLLASTCLALPPVKYYVGRSADIIVQPYDSVARQQDATILFKGDQFSTTQLDTLEDTRFADLFAHVMGTQPFHLDADRRGFPTTSMFNKPKAAIVIAVDYTGEDVLSKYPELSILQGAHKSTLATQSFPINTHTILANLATGTTPDAHGIVDGTWHKSSGSLVAAYDSNGKALAANIADIFLQEFSGALVVSASASSSLASALAAHPELVESHAEWNAHAYSYSDDGFVSRYMNDNSLGLSRAELKDVTVTVGDSKVDFRTTIQEDAALLSELAFVNNMIAKLKSNAKLNKLVTDEIPDLYSFVFSSLKGIAENYGQDSTHFVAALNLVDKSISSLIASLNELYNNRVANAIVILPSPAFTTASASLKETVYNNIGRLVYSKEDFEAHFPAVYVRPNELVGNTRDITCSNLQKAIANQAQVLCLAPRYPTRTLRSIQADANCTGNCTNNDDSDTVWAFWLNFWITLVIAVFIGWGAYCLAYVGSDASKDSLLFRATGRHHHQN